MDTDGDDRLNYSEFANRLVRSGIFIDVQSISKIFRRFDTNDDGYIDKTEF